MLVAGYGVATIAMLRLRAVYRDRRARRFAVMLAGIGAVVGGYGLLGQWVGAVLNASIAVALLAFWWWTPWGVHGTRRRSWPGSASRERDERG